MIRFSHDLNSWMLTAIANGEEIYIKHLTIEEARRCFDAGYIILI